MPPSYSKKDGKDRKGNQKFRPDPNKFLFNIDTFWYNVDILNYDEVMESGLLEELENGRQLHMDYNEEKTVEVRKFPLQKIRGEFFQVGSRVQRNAVFKDRGKVVLGGDDVRQAAARHGGDVFLRRQIYIPDLPLT